LPDDHRLRWSFNGGIPLGEAVDLLPGIGYVPKP